MNTSTSFTQNFSPKHANQSFSIEHNHKQPAHESNSNQIVKNVIANASKGAEFYINQSKNYQNLKPTTKNTFARTDTKNSTGCFSAKKSESSKTTVLPKPGEHLSLKIASHKKEKIEALHGNQIRMPPISMQKQKSMNFRKQDSRDNIRR